MSASVVHCCVTNHSKLWGIKMHHFIIFSPEMSSLCSCHISWAGLMWSPLAPEGPKCQNHWCHPLAGWLKCEGPCSSSRASFPISLSCGVSGIFYLVAQGRNNCRPLMASALKPTWHYCCHIPEVKEFCRSEGSWDPMWERTAQGQRPTVPWGNL